MELIGISIVIFVLLVASFLYGYKVGRKRRVDIVPPVQYKDPSTFPCPVCSHSISEHASNWHASSNGCQQKRCWCARSQESLVKESAKWAITPPTTDVLLEFINQSSLRKKE